MLYEDYFEKQEALELTENQIKLLQDFSDIVYTTVSQSDYNENTLEKDGLYSVFRDIYYISLAEVHSTCMFSDIEDNSFKLSEIKDIKKSAIQLEIETIIKNFMNKLKDSFNKEQIKKLELFFDEFFVLEERFIKNQIYNVNDYQLGRITTVKTLMKGLRNI